MPSKLEEKFDYEPLTGALRWKFTNAQHLQGEIAGFIGANGYWHVYHEGKLLKGHRVAWYLTYGTWPKTIDHVNGDRLDNRLDNLREATYSQQQHNKGRQSNNTSGIKGVCWFESKQMWAARVQVAGKRKFLGYFPTPEAAEGQIQKYRDAVHKEFARHE